MNGNTWLWIALTAFLAFCVLSMLFMGGHRRRQPDAVKEEDRVTDK